MRLLVYPTLCVPVCFAHKFHYFCSVRPKFQNLKSNLNCVFTLLDNTSHLIELPLAPLNNALTRMLECGCGVDRWSGLSTCTLYVIVISILVGANISTRRWPAVTEQAFTVCIPNDIRGIFNFRYAHWQHSRWVSWWPTTTSGMNTYSNRSNGCNSDNRKWWWEMSR